MALGVVGAILELVSQRVEEGRTRGAPSGSGPLADFVVAQHRCTAHALAEKGLPPAAARRRSLPSPRSTSSCARRSARFVANELRPHVSEWEDAEWFPNEVFTRMAELGFLGLKYPEEYGGEGGDYVHDAVLTEELSRRLRRPVGGHRRAHRHRHAADLEVRHRGPEAALPRPGDPRREDRRARHHRAGRRLRRRRHPHVRAQVDGGYVVNGSKTFITNGVRADFLVTAVKTTEEGGHHGLSFLLIEKEMEGYSVSKKLEKLGWHASDTAELAFQDVFVPDENLLGEENKGFYLIMANFQWERLLMALGAVGVDAAHDRASVAYALERTAFGRPIGKLQAIRHKIAEMATKHEASRSLTYHALRLFADGQDATREVTEAKLLTQRAAYEVADDALQIHGGAGYMKEYEIERAARDTRLGPIGGGTDEVMKEILAKQLGL